MRNDRAKRGNKQLGVWGRCKPPNGAGAKPRKILKFEASGSPKINNSNTKSFFLLLVEFVIFKDILGDFNYSSID